MQQPRDLQSPISTTAKQVTINHARANLARALIFLLRPADLVGTLGVCFRSALNASTTSPIPRSLFVAYFTMPTQTLVVGSTVRDFCMLERNFLSHIKLVLLMCILSSSALLGIRLPGPAGTAQSDSLGTASLPIGALQFIAAALTIAAAFWEYHTGLDDLIKTRAFLTSMRLVSATLNCRLILMAACRTHPVIMALVMTILVTTCVVYVIKSS